MAQIPDTTVSMVSSPEACVHVLHVDGSAFSHMAGFLECLGHPDAMTLKQVLHTMRKDLGDATLDTLLIPVSAIFRDARVLSALLLDSEGERQILSTLQAVVHLLVGLHPEGSEPQDDGVMAQNSDGPSEAYLYFKSHMTLLIDPKWAVADVVSILSRSLFVSYRLFPPSGMSSDMAMPLLEQIWDMHQRKTLSGFVRWVRGLFGTNDISAFLLAVDRVWEHPKSGEALVALQRLWGNREVGAQFSTAMRLVHQGLVLTDSSTSFQLVAVKASSYEALPFGNASYAWMRKGLEGMLSFVVSPKIPEANFEFWGTVKWLGTVAPSLPQKAWSNKDLASGTLKLGKWLWTVFSNQGFFRATQLANTAKGLPYMTDGALLASSVMGERMDKAVTSLAPLWNSEMGTALESLVAKCQTHPALFGVIPYVRMLYTKDPIAVGRMLRQYGDFILTRLAAHVAAGSGQKIILEALQEVVSLVQSIGESTIAKDLDIPLDESKWLIQSRSSQLIAYWHLLFMPRSAQ